MKLEVAVDLDIDSDNNEGYSGPEGFPEEEILEEDPDVGKLVSANTGDLDANGLGDGLVDLACLVKLGPS